MNTLKYATRLDPVWVERAMRNPVPWGPLGYVTFKRTYARMRDDLGRTEEFGEMLSRGVNALLEYGMRMTNEEVQTLYEYMYQLKCGFAGRMNWQLGTPTVAKIGGASCCNCFYISVKDIEAFCFTFDMLMLGGGVGFGITPSDVYTLPKVIGPVNVIRRDGNDVDFIVPDNREGWVELLRRTLQAYFFTGRSFTYSTHCVRGKGERIKGFGGIASGPGELVKGIGQICGVLSGRIGKKIRPVDALDIMNIIGSIVVSGNVRRSAQIAVGSPKDIDFLEAKMWSKGNIPNWRGNSNNTVLANEISELTSAFWDGYLPDQYGNAKGENYGLFNLDLSRNYGRLIDGPNYRLDPRVEGPNPCAEQSLEDGECCDLAEQYLPNLRDRSEFVTSSMMMYKVCKTVLQLPFQWAKTQEVVTRNQRMGVGVSGFCQAQHFDKDDYTAAYQAMESLDESYSKEIKSNKSIKLSTVKPSGCRPADALTTTSKGILTLSEMLAGHDVNDEWSDYSDGDAVLDGKSSRITKTYRNGVARIYQVNLSYGMTLKATAEHRWFVDYHKAYGGANGQKPVQDWVRTDNLSAGDVIHIRLGTYENEEPFALKAEDNRRPVQAGELSVPTHMNEDLAWLLGYLWGNGCQSEQKGRLRFISQHVFTLKKVQDCLQSQFGLSSNISQCNDRDASTLEIGSVRLWDWMHDNGLNKADDEGNIQLIPESVRRSSWKHVVAFLAGLIDADGCASYNREGDKKTLILSTKYDHFAEHIQHVSAAVGMLFGRSLNTQGTNWQVGGKHMWLMNLSQHVQEKAFSELSKHSTKIAKINEDYPDTKWNHEVVGRRSAFIPGKVSSVVGAGVCETFDVEVENDHWYYAGSVKSHNTVSLLAGVTPGVHPAFSRYYIRRIRFSAEDPLVEACRKNGYRIEPKYEFDGTPDHTTQIVEFPVDVGANTLTASQVSAVKQLEMQEFLQTYWSDNAVSVTVYYRDEELPEVQEKLKETYKDRIKTTSFLRHSNHGFKQAPYEEITAEQYEEMASKCIPVTSLSDAQQWDIVDSLECASGVCPTK